MLKLVKCEFWKLKRKKFIPLVILSAFLFPVPLTYLMTTPSMMERYTDKADAFDGLFNMVLGYGIQFLLPCIIGIIELMRLYVVGGGGCMIQNFGEYDKSRVTIVRDICATAKGYEAMTVRKIQRNGGMLV